MRPLHLEITAFGSYAGKTELPFEDLRHDLYLVTGDTGAGKTTIFDAIMFALFGRASGTDRKGDMLHCDHVPKSTDTVVKLRFSQDGKKYIVTRKLHFSKKRGTEERYGDGKLSAVLEEPDRAATEGSEKVSARCEELLGMNAEQFRKIIMLAQGEFKEFLKADSDKKNEILGKLFDNSVYVYYQNLFIGAKEALRQKREKDDAQLENLMRSTFMPPDDSEETELAFLPGHPRLAENLVRLTEEEQGKLDTLRSERDRISRNVAAINTKKGAAETVNGLILDLKNERERMAGLEKLDPEIAARKQVYERAEAAFRKARPAVDLFTQADRRLKDTSEEVRELTGRLEELDRAVESAQKTVDTDAETVQERDAVKSKLDAIEGQLPRYRELAKKQADLNAARTAAEQAASEREAEEARRDLAGKEILHLKERLEELDRADADFQRSADQKQRAEDTLENLDGKKGLRKDLLDIRKLEQKNEKEKARLLALTEESQAAMDRYSALYRRFIAGQAGLLADDLRDALAKKDEAVCPVCGTKLSPDHLEQLAPRPEETPDKEALEAAEKRKNDAEAQRGKQVTVVETNTNTIGLKKDAALERAKALLADCESWEQLNDPAYFTAAVEQARAAVEEARVVWSAAKERKAERDRCKEQLPDKEREQNGYLERIKTLQEEQQRQSNLAAGLESAIREMRKQLLHEEEAAAKQEKKELEEKYDTLSHLLQTHQDALKKAKGERDVCEGNLTGKQAEEEKCVSALDSARSEMERVLEETGFDSSDAMNRALEPMGETDGESWLNAELAALTEHDYQKQHTKENIKKLEAQTEGKQFVDLTELNQELEAAEQESKQADAAFSAQDALLKNHRSVLEQVRKLRKRLDTSEPAWRRLSALAALAGGASSEVGKISFDRYVMGAVFREVLEMANRRMELMSGGRYELVHKTSAARKNAKAGLEIEVLDNITGLQRGSGSLSGGESFFTSLALALGLSDVVQNHAGGKRMDALFIDEGFGTLSSDVLEKALEVLNQLTDGNRLVGIISHVDKLDESIPQKVRVRHGDRGSSLTVELV